MAEKVYLATEQKQDAIQKAVDNVNTNVDAVKNSVSSVNTNVSTVKTDVGTVKTQVSNVNTNVSSVLSVVNTINGSTGKPSLYIRKLYAGDYGIPTNNGGMMFVESSSISYSGASVKFNVTGKGRLIGLAPNADERPYITLDGRVYIQITSGGIFNLSFSSSLTLHSNYSSGPLLIVYELY